jgi:ATP-dependent RNA helicase DDX42
LDIRAVKTVINYHVARDIESHIHRVGRTGRAGDKEGIAFTLITKKEDHFAGELVKNLEGANQHVPPELLELAMQVSLSLTHHFIIKLLFITSDLFQKND